MLLSSIDHHEAVQSKLNEDNIKWKFITPRSPHFGGLQGVGVKSVKYHLVWTVGKSCLTNEELYTVLCTTESCLNSRPIIPLSSDPSDLTYLSPGHFLVGQPLTAIPEEDEQLVNISLLTRWQPINQITQYFWERWRKGYITELQTRVKWRSTLLQLRNLII